jgi:putative FmdB family regulatory protein
MPLYEYLCADCHTKFEVLRKMSLADEPISCRQCNSPHTSRVLSIFAAVSRSSDGQAHSSVAGTRSGCAGCGTRNCSTCAHT